jgi:hypothetical protein
MRSSANALVVALSLTCGLAHAGEGAYATARASAARKVKSATSQLEAGRLKTSPQLRFTRDVLASPGSDWGIYGVGEVFKEKRTALTNLRWARQNLESADADLVNAHKTTRWWNVGRRGSIKKGRAEINGKLAEVDKAREALRATTRAWSELGFLTYSATADQVRVLKAMVDDRPGDEPIIERHLDDHIRGMR